MKLFETTKSRENCFRRYNGYTEINGTRYGMTEGPFGFWVSVNAIIFGYEYDSMGAETGLDYGNVLYDLGTIGIPINTITRTYGGYVNREGTQVEEKGIMATFDSNLSPLVLGATAHRIATMFRQGSVLVIYNGEASFVYA